MAIQPKGNRRFRRGRKSSPGKIPKHIRSDLERLEAYIARNDREYVAVFDIGTRAARLLVGPRNVPKEWTKDQFYNVAYVYNLGACVHQASKTLATNQKSVGKLASFMRIFHAALRQHGIVKIDAIGTAIFRWLTNRTEVLDYFEKVSGLRIDAINGPLEAELTLRSVCTILEKYPRESLKPEPEDIIAVADQGGGSLEVSWIRWGDRNTERPRIESVRSDSLGTIALQNEFLSRSAGGDLVAPIKNRAQIGAQTRRIREIAEKQFEGWNSLLRQTTNSEGKVHLFGVGTAITNAGKVAGFRNHRRIMTIQQLEAQVKDLAAEYDGSNQQVMTLYRAMNGLKGKGVSRLKNPDKVKDHLSVLYGVPIYSEVMKAMRLPSLSIFGFGLRFGFYLWKYEQDEPVPFIESNENGPFAFISYARKDALAVYREMHELKSTGYRLAYDQGILPIEDFAVAISRMITNCKIMIVYWTKHSVASVEVKKEILFAVRQGKPILQVYLEDVELPKDLAFRLGAEQYLSRHNHPYEQFLQLVETTIPNECKQALDSQDACEDEEVNS